jgi:putative Mn2+ efflux pump MntP
MVRFIAAIVIGYLVMLVVVIGVFSAAYPLVGIDRLFEPGSYEAAPGWIALSFGVGLVAAMTAGSLCARIAPATAAPLWLAAIVLVLGGLMAIPVIMSANTSRGGPRPPGITMADAIAHAEQPKWVALLNPLVGALGVLMGAGPRGYRSRT